MKVGFSNSNTLYNIQQKKADEANSLNKLSSTEKSGVENPALAMIANAMMSGMIEDVEGIKNANIASGMMEIAGGALSQVSDMSSKLQELSVASNNATLSSSDKKTLKTEFDATLKSIDSAISSATFNGKKLFGEEMTFSLGKSDISISLSDFNTKDISINSQESIKDFASLVNSVAGDIGSTQNSLESASDNLSKSMIQKSASRSQMSDVDIADALRGFEENEMKLNASLMAQAHRNDISAQRVAALLD